jgi:hypothetical protein
VNRETLKLAAVFALLAFLMTLTRNERVLLEVTPTRVDWLVWTWLPGRLSSGLLGGLVLLGGLAALALVAHLLWVALRPARGSPGEWAHFAWYRLALCREGSRKEALIEDAKLLLGTVVASAILAGVSYYSGSTHRVVLDLDAWHYRRTTDYLGLLTTRVDERSLWDVVEARLERKRHEDADGDVSYTYSAAFLLRDGSTDSIDGPKDPCQKAVDAVQRLLADRRATATGVERAAPPRRD